jgi:hypothetical protein
LDDKATFRNSGFNMITYNNELFQNLIFLAVLISNTIFLFVWAYTFIGVQVRIHFRSIKKVLLFMNISFAREMQDYETDLSSYLKKREEAPVERKRKPLLREVEKGDLTFYKPFKSKYF